MSVLEEQNDDVLEMTFLPALQALLERMESLAGRVVANEIMAIAEEGGYGAQDNFGRERLLKLCTDFHQQCSRVSREKEIEQLHWRVQAMSRSSQAMFTTADEPPARLRVPTSRKAENMWNPGFWSIARPTDFCYGDCVWG